MRSHPTIYFVQAEPPEGPVKIGYTGRRTRDRMAEGQTFASRELVVLAETYGTRVDESQLHRLFQEFHIRGEWYKYELPIRELIHYLVIDEGSLQGWLDAL